LKLRATTANPTAPAHPAPPAALPPQSSQDLEMTKAHRRAGAAATRQGYKPRPQTADECRASRLFPRRPLDIGAAGRRHRADFRGRRAACAPRNKNRGSRCRAAYPKNGRRRPPPRSRQEPAQQQFSTRTLMTASELQRGGARRSLSKWRKRHNRSRKASSRRRPIPVIIPIDAVSRTGLP
jgi:hypothetical protein